ncbi:hypothetical protein VP01_1486g4 [Puccinia sorghi]|uniref:AAA+ ATPase domain-containing protein n=1 Tax=Puccinia sorghi TaxID=27349 RepID=A0A0L6VK27_9BASI|nr:hypothetical protein VP01_1486g4 [Puccinia sorghi]
MEEEENLLELDDSFFNLLGEKHSQEDTAQAQAIVEERDIEGEASEARRALHAFERNRHDPQVRTLNTIPNLSPGGLVPQLDGEEEGITDRSTKKARLDSDPPSSATHLNPGPGITTHHSTIIRDSIPSAPNGIDQDETGLDDLEPDEAFTLLRPPGVRPEHDSSNDASKEGAASGHANDRESDLAALELEVDPVFMAPILKPSAGPVDWVIRGDRPPFDSPLSFDEMMEEAENYHEDDQDLLEMDSHFGDTHPRPPTSAQRPTTIPNTSFSEDPIQARWVPTASLVATKLDGTKIRIPRRKKIGFTQVTRGSKSTEALQKQCLALLDEPIHRMLQAVREEILHKDAMLAASASLPPKIHVSNNTPRSLWTDRYRPAKFIDLIGDERTFRNAMSWLKTWDRCVFKKVESNKRKRINKAQQQSNSYPQSNSFAEAAESDPYGRPHEKVLLLAGKPGLGKTTMAHVLATQAGYQVVEINASDDRSSRTVTEQIKSALECRTLDAGALFGGGLSLKSNRPTCVIIDEIDGAGGGGGAEGNENGFVKALVKLVTEGSASTATIPISRKGKSLDQRPLVRPIICICNDLYSPVLRPLRPISRIVRFNNPTPLTIVKRLQTICKSEKLVADLNNLNYLVKLASGDLRSCLNTLQFISTQSTTLTDQIIKSALESAVKDSASSLQTVLSHIFKIPVKKSASKNDPSSSKNEYLNELVRDISICGQNDRIVQGCFEAYLGMKQPTDMWRTYDRLYDWLEFYDRLETKIWKDQEYQLAGYVPYSIVIWRELMGNVTNKAPDYPKVDYEHYLKRSVNLETLSAFSSHLPPIIKSSFKHTELLCELLPYLIRILSVDLRPVNSKLFKKDEKEALARLVSIMRLLGLKPVDFPAYYEGKRPADIPPPRYSMAVLARGTRNHLDRPAHPSSEGPPPATAASIINAYKQKPNAPRAGLPEEVALDFFGRKRAQESAGLARPPLAGQQEAPPRVTRDRVKVLYRYHEIAYFRWAYS